MTRLRNAMLVVVLTAFFPAAAPAGAQQPERAAAGPRIDQTAVGLRAAVGDGAHTMMQARTNSMGKPVALIVVGGAAVILGSVIGDDIGTLFTIGGAVALLYGLYLYLR